MKVSSVFVVASTMGALSTVIAAPTPDNSPSDHPHVLFKREKKCPSSIEYKGVCNGTSCKWGLGNYKCEHGKCTGKGAGDGACCGWKNWAGKAFCPNGGF